MPPRMMTQSAGRSTAAPPVGGMGGRVGRRARRTREPVRRNNETIGKLDGQGNDQGIEANGGVGGVPDFSTIIARQLQNVLPTLLAQVGNQGCTYKEFLACNPKEYDAIPIGLRRWSQFRIRVGVGITKKVKYAAGSFVGKALTWWNSQIHTRSREAAVGMA
ncbi:hypothetical protein Tco_1508084 [Tanacetum coccineum]